MSRKSHIKRITGKSKPTGGGEPVDEPDVYVDVARIDTLDTVEWPGAQENQINLQWKDAPGEDGNPGRRMGNVRLIDPEETNRDDPSVWIDLPVIERMTLVRHPGAQEQVTSFQPSSADPQADELETARRVAIRRVTNAETNVDVQLDARGYLADDGDYARKADTIDDTQYLDVEIIESYPSTLHQGPSPQEVLVSLINDDLKEMFSPPPGDAKRNPARLDPFQNIVNVQWGGGATEFEPGSMIQQAAATAANSSKLTVSMWCRVQTTNAPSANGDLYSLLEFGNPNGVIDRVGDGASNYIQLRTNSNGAYGNWLGIQIAGVLNSVIGADVITHASSPFETGSINLPLWTANPYKTFIGDPYSYDAATTFTPYVGLASTDLGSSVAPERWFHLFVAIDVSYESTYADPFGGNKIIAAVNGNVVPFDGIWTDANRPTRTDGKVIPYMASTGSDFFSRGPYEWVGGAGGSASGKIPAFDVDLSGMEIGIPSQVASTNKNTHLLDMADVQIWVGQYIDPTVHIEKFVKLDPDDPTKPLLVDPHVAQNAFGQPTFFFDGPPSKFAINRGSGGDFTKIGELKSFRPGPPKAPAPTP